MIRDKQWEGQEGWVTLPDTANGVHREQYNDEK